MSHGHSNKDPNPLLQLSRGMPASTQGTRGRQSLLTRCLWNRRGWRHLLLLSNWRRGGDLVKLLLGDQADCLRVRDWPRLDRHRTTHFHSTHTPHLSQERLLKAFHSNALSSGNVTDKKIVFKIECCWGSQDPRWGSGGKPWSYWTDRNLETFWSFSRERRTVNLKREEIMLLTILHEWITNDPYFCLSTSYSNGKNHILQKCSGKWTTK